MKKPRAKFKGTFTDRVYGIFSETDYKGEFFYVLAQDNSADGWGDTGIEADTIIEARFMADKYDHCSWDELNERKAGL